MNEPIAASISAAFKCWHVYSGEYTQDEDSKHWGAFWEPLRCDFSPEARPYCCLTNTIQFYDPDNRRELGRVHHYGFMAAHPHLLHLEGKWREVINGRVEYRDGQWFMRWGVATNTRWAMKLNEVQAQHD
jgi:hypothetical protein